MGREGKYFGWVAGGKIVVEERGKHHGNDGTEIYGIECMETCGIKT
jgi:hypothetical protein